MKLKFIKKQDNDFSIKIEEGAKSRNFEYIYFIDNAYKNKTIEDPEFEGDFLDLEKDRIMEMVKDLRNIITPKRRRRKVED